MGGWEEVIMKLISAEAEALLGLAELGNISQFVQNVKTQRRSFSFASPILKYLFKHGTHQRIMSYSSA